jgi:L-iditol 2-dehydrogenase
LKALVLTEYKQLDLIDVDKPETGAEDLLIRIHSCGICGSDVHGYDGSTGRRLPPVIMGHEAAGVVEAVGSTVTRFRPGDRVTFDSTVYCGNCFYCHRGEVNLCDNRQVIGVSTPEFRRMGAFAEYVVVPERVVYALPDKMPFEHAALIEAVSIAVHAVSLTSIALGDTIVVIGAGMIGLLTLQAALLAGASRVYVCDVDESRLELARSLGATGTFNSHNANPVHEIQKLTEGRGADAALECVGLPATVKLAIEVMRKGAPVTLVGNISPVVEIGLQTVVTRQIRLQGSCASSGEYPACISLIARGAIQVEPLLSAVAPLKEGAEWFRRLYAREPGLMKVVLQP